jgi:phosphate starvation-inducible PhoH-like protein
VPPEPAASAAGPGAPETTRAHTTDAAPERPSRVVVVPPTVPMLALLGPHDQLLTTMERNLPSVEIFVRGNEIHMAGPELELDLAERLLDELLVIAATGQPLNRDAVERSIRMLRDQSASGPPTS